MGVFRPSLWRPQAVTSGLQCHPDRQSVDSIQWGNGDMPLMKRDPPWGWDARRTTTMDRRKFLIGMGSLAAGGAAAMGTGAFEGAYVNADRSLTIDTSDDSTAILGLVATSPYASYESTSGRGGAEGGDLSANKLQVDLDNLNVDADTRLDDVFRVRNNSGSEISLLINDTTNWQEDVVQIWAQPTDNGTDVGSAVRLDDGGDVTIGPGEAVEINIFVLLGSYDPNGSPYNMSLEFSADGTDS